MLQKIKEFQVFPEKFGLFPYIFLIYLVMPSYTVIIVDGWKRIIGIGLILLFLVSYRQLYHSIDRRAYAYWLALQIGIIVILAVYYNLYNLYLGFFSSYFIGWFKVNKLFYLATAIFSIAMISPLLVHWDALSNLDGNLYNSVILAVMLISPYGIRSMGKRMELEKKLDEANEKIEELVKRDERMRIARDLHDTLGHTLSLLTLKSQLVHKLISNDVEKAQLETKEIEKISRSALQQVRELVSDMRTVTVAEELIETEAILQSAGITFHFDGDSELKEVPLLTQNILSMCLKEGVTNVVRHSGAKNCVVVLRKRAGEIQLSIQDDGKGFVDSYESGNGLKGIGERLRLIDGQVKIISHSGMKLCITVPIIVKEKKAGVGS